MTPTVSAMDGGSTIFGTSVSDIQDDIEISGGKITGKSLYLSTGAIAEHWGAGHFLALQFTTTDWGAYDSVKVGLSPSMGSGLADIKNDPDHNGSFKISDKYEQKIVIDAVKGTKRTRTAYDLSNLELADAGA